MNVSPVLLDDDDVVIIENDDSKSSRPKENANTTEDTIILDEEPLTSNGKGKCEEPSPRKKSTVKKSEIPFARLLRNNMLMNKIVQECLSMASNAGMSRVVNKTLLPLYADLNNEFKASRELTDVLKLNLKKLRSDPNYKFLHLKSLCEDFKPWIFKKRVPLVTLSKDLKGEKQKRSLERAPEKNKNQCPKPCNSNQVKSMSKETDHRLSQKTFNAGHRPPPRFSTTTNPELRISNGCLPTPRLSKKTDIIINLDTSDDEPVTALDDDDISIVNDDHSNDIMIVDETAISDGGSEKSNKENSIDVNENCKTPNKSVPNEDLVPKSNSKLSKVGKCDLLVPKKAVNPDQHSLDYRQCVLIEEQIALYQQKILELEEAEVTDNMLSSPYLQCGRFKAMIVELYKKLCKITGHGDGNLLKQRVVRLQVVEGHPPGPVKRLERFLNSTIDETGAVPLPDLHDVVRCVTQSNIADRLGWNQREIMTEAIGLFTQCCQALRKSRQKREYKDLMGLVRDKSLDDYDPANEDPNLCAKLEENKIIAKVNEEEILERFVKMERMPIGSQLLTPRLGMKLKIKESECTDTESESESEPTLSNKYEKRGVQDNKNAQETAKNTIDTSSNINESKICNTKVNNEQPTEQTKDNFVNLNCIETAIDTILKKALTTIADKDSNSTAHPQINITTRDHTNIIIQNYDTCSKSNRTTQTATNVNERNTANATNSIPNQPTTSQNIISTTNSSNNVTQIQRRQSLPNTLQKIGNSNMYVVSIESQDNTEQSGLCSDVKLEKREDFEAIETKTSENTEVRVKTEDVTVKQELIDISSQLSSLGDNYVSTIFDIEDPFLVIEISDSSDDEL